MPEITGLSLSMELAMAFTIAKLTVPQNITAWKEQMYDLRCYWPATLSPIVMLRNHHCFLDRLLVRNTHLHILAFPNTQQIEEMDIRWQQFTTALLSACKTESLQP